jgi:hypothetical protein
LRQELAVDTPRAKLVTRPIEGMAWSTDGIKAL